MKEITGLAIRCGIIREIDVGGAEGEGISPPPLLVEVGTDHRLADPEPLGAMLRACNTTRFEKDRRREA
jgi:hypothetical protein